MSAPTADPSARELIEHTALQTASDEARSVWDAIDEEIRDTERELVYMREQLVGADTVADEAAEKLETFLTAYWAKRGGEPGR